MNICILGHTGFVGKRVYQHLAKIENSGDISVHGLSRSAGCDLRTPEDVMAQYERLNPDVFVNCAAHVGSLRYVSKHAASVMTDNLRMIVNHYDCVARLPGSPLTINPIANCAYPGHREVYIEDDIEGGPLHPTVASYGSTRRVTLHLSNAFATEHNLRSINMLVPNIYGPGDSPDPEKAHAVNALVSKFVQAEKAGRDFVEVWGDGSSIREWLYVDDFVRIVEAIIFDEDLARSLITTSTNIAKGKGVSIRRVVEMLEEYFGCKIHAKYEKTGDDGAPKKIMDSARFNELFPDFQFTEMEDGIPETIRSYGLHPLGS